jgi:DNA-binding transcriptional MerR regulator
MSPATSSLLRIGPFSRLARVTIKTLRFYDSAGLFRPVWVDPRSGYRFYCASQVPALRRIRLLRDLGCSVAEVRELIVCDPDRQLHLQRLSGLRRRLLVKVAFAEQKLRQLDGLLQSGERASLQSRWPTARPSAPQRETRLPLVERQIAPTPAFTIRDCVRASGNDIHRMFESAERKVARLGGRSWQSPFLLLHDMAYRQPQMDVEVCVPVGADSLDTPGVRLVEPVPRATCVGFSGSYEQAPLLFDAALDSMQGATARIAGPVREVYLRFGANQRGYKLDPRFVTDDVAQYRTELQIPITA